MRHSGSDGLLDTVLAETIPAYGRMIHGEDKKGALTEESQLYDVHGRFQRAVDRGALNKVLLDHLERLPNVKLFFHHKLTGADFNKKSAWFEYTTLGVYPDDRPSEVEVTFDLILGCDGAHSSVRYHMMKFVRMDYAQSYIDTLWCEFTISPADSDATVATTPSAKDGFRTSPNHFHIWPAGDMMFLAIASKDKTFTCTLFAPAATFKALEQAPDTIEEFFRVNFPGAADLVGPGLQKQFQTNPHLPLISIKCSPHHFQSSGVILGDAAHAMVPFYGQGMNAGLEDVRVLFQHLDAHPSTDDGKLAALGAYTKERVPDAHMINDLAMGNYWEMHSGVRSSMYLLRKRVEEFLSNKVPSSGFATQYSRVSFSNQRYSDVAKAVEWQKRILLRSMAGGTLIPVLGFAAWIVLSRRRSDNGTSAWSAVFGKLREVLMNLRKQ
jgi:kynurenine 3-monooxygenase